MRTETVPVLVVGGGPVGLATALFLQHRGVRTLVVDKRDPTTAPPRAGTSLRTLELFRSVGLQSALDREGWEAYGTMRSVFKSSAFGSTLHRVDLPPRYAERIETCSPANPRQILTQREIQRIALDEVRRLGGTVRFDARLTGFDCDGDGVRARLADTGSGEEFAVEAAYLVAADGANSGIRRQLGITVPDRQVVARLNTAFFRADLGPVLDDWQTHMCFVRNDGVYATLLSKNGRDLWSSHLMDYPGKPDELAELSAARTIELLRTAIGDDSIPVELHAVNAWEAAIGMASAFRRGPVFLVGDAAHVQSSAGGLGMNTGIQDGHNLAWKLAAVLHGQAAPALLDTYEPERRAGARASLALSLGMHEGYRDPDGDPNLLYERMAVDYLRGMMFYGYRSAAVLADEEPNGEPDVLDDDARPGRRLPHQWLDTGAGTRSTLDLAGTGWALLAGPRGRAWRTAAEAAGAALGVDVRAHGADGTAAIASVDPEGAVLVRPDGFVAWRSGTGGSAPEAAVRGALSRVLGRG